MKKQNKKGFTIVELVIVIAVIAILAAVLIPTFSNLIKKAQTSGDISVVRNINEGLAINEATNGKVNTMYDALVVAKEYGYDVSKITPTNEDNDIVFDTTTGRFALLDKQGNVLFADEAKESEAIKGNKVDVAYKVFKLYTKLADAKAGEYSIYAGPGFDTKVVEGLTVGFDAGEEAITNVKYIGTDSAQDVVIRTNSYDTVLTINAPADTVKHYDKANKIDVEAVAMASYHEFGDIKNIIKLVSGHVELEEKSSIGAIEICAASAENVKVTIDSTAEYRYIFATDSDSKSTTTTDAILESVVTTEGAIKIYSEKTYTENEETKTYKAYGMDTKNYYKTLQEAYSSSNNIVVMTDIELTTIFEITKSDLSIDLNGHKISRNNISDSGAGNTAYCKNSSDPVFWVHSGGNVTFYDSVGTGAVIGKSLNGQKGAAFNINHNVGGSDSETRSYVTLKGGTFEGGYAGSYIFYNGEVLLDGATVIGINGFCLSNHGAHLTFDSGLIKSTSYYGVAGNGSGDRDPYTFIMNGGKIEASVGVYHSNSGTVIINGGEIVGANTAIEVRAGKLTVNGGRLKATANKYEVTSNGSGSTTAGAALAIAQHQTEKDIYVEIKNGTFEGYKSLSIAHPETSKTSNNNVVVINENGKFLNDIVIDEYSAQHYQITGLNK